MTPGISKSSCPNGSDVVIANRYRDVKNQRHCALDESQGTIEDDVGSEVYAELLSEFLAHLALQRIELVAAAGDGDVAGAQRVAHQIKGTAPSFGAARLDDLAHRLLGMDGADVELLCSLVRDVDAEILTLQANVDVPAGRE